jgi:hypothetical protein
LAGAGETAVPWPNQQENDAFFSNQWLDQSPSGAISLRSQAFWVEILMVPTFVKGSALSRILPVAAGCASVTSAQRWSAMPLMPDVPHQQGTIKPNRSSRKLLAVLEKAGLNPINR